MRPLVPEDIPRNSRAAVDLLTRAAIAVGLSKLDLNIHAASYARAQWPTDHRVELIMRAAVSPASISTAGPLATVA